MAKLFIGIAVVVMLATAALSFLAKGNIDKLQTSLKDTKSHVAETEAKARTAKSDAEKAQKEAKDADDKATAATEQATTATKALDDARKAKDELTLVVDAKDKEIAALNVKLTTAAPVAAPTGPSPEEFAKLQADKTNAEHERDEAKQLLESQTNHVKDLEGKYSAIELKERKRAQQFGAAGLQGRILAVNSGWNFVVLSVGDKQGVSINSPLLVVRGSQPVARLRITSVEPQTSIADVLPGSVSRGVTVQPGDTVIFEGGRNASPASDSKPAADSAATGTVPPLPQ